MSMTLQTERLALRRPEPGDYGACRAFLMSDRAQYLGGPKSLGDTWRTFASELGHWEMMGYGMWAVTERGDNDAVGGLCRPMEARTLARNRDRLDDV